MPSVIPAETLDGTEHPMLNMLPTLRERVISMVLEQEEAIREKLAEVRIYNAALDRLEQGRDPRLMQAIVRGLPVPLPEAWALRIAHEASDYVAKRFNHLVQNTPDYPQVIPPVTLDSHLVMACDRLVVCLTEAFNNPINMEIDIVWYSEHVGPMNTGQNKEKEERLLHRFPPGHNTDGPMYLDKPATVLDSLSRMIMWYLPGAFNEETQKQMVVATQLMESQLQHSLHAEGHSSWRTNEELFSHGSDQSPPGCINFSPAWFQQAHNLGYDQEVSALLKASAALRVMHPEQYFEGLRTFGKLDEAACRLNLPFMPDALEQWSSVFTVLTVISNRESPFHRDVKSCPQWFDILESVGNYENGGMVLPGLGIELMYYPGVMVGISGKIICHGVPRVDGDRICWAWYMWDAVHEYAGIP
ncbi:uncharacterized protein EDB91DRAFT_1255995 [Suillus paluster]|uniref:uncharacterized protein n=1 Tax=Suillus paluster TaxID=48578 RepID=UPI001B86B192|nr:uncharacterized protein EDB91DRAFT_1255995 [Suillus paluster]KAG1722599.1 hypothetical protein EDB91DRAFT_1255995 [Suillus paluster]